MPVECPEIKSSFRYYVYTLETLNIIYYVTWFHILHSIFLQNFQHYLWDKWYLACYISNVSVCHRLYCIRGYIEKFSGSVIR